MRGNSCLRHCRGGYSSVGVQLLMALEICPENAIPEDIDARCWAGCPGSASGDALPEYYVSRQRMYMVTTEPVGCRWGSSFWRLCRGSRSGAHASWCSTAAAAAQGWSPATGAAAGKRVGSCDSETCPVLVGTISRQNLSRWEGKPSWIRGDV